MRRFIAGIFHGLFSIPFLKNSYYGFHKRIFKPLNLFKGVATTINYRGDIHLRLHIDDWIQQHLYFLHEYEEKEIRFIEQFLKKGDVFIDIGANIGLFSLVASKLVGEAGTVYAFEPFTMSYDNLVANADLNNSVNIIIEKLAVSDKSGQLNLYLDEKEKDSGMVSAYATVYTIAATATATTLDSFFAHRDTSAIRLIKIDIENGEYPALTGMEQLLRDQKPAILIEINSSQSYTKVTAFLSALGYKQYFIGNDGSAVNNKLPEDSSNNYLFL